MNLFYTYKGLVVDGIKKDIIVAKNVVTNEKNYFYPDDNGQLHLFTGEERKIIEDYSKSHQVGLQTYAKIANFAKKHAEISKKHGVKSNLLDNNLKHIIAYNVSNTNFRYEPIGNEIIVDYSKREFDAALAHEVGHMEFTEHKVDIKRKKVVIHIGLMTQEADIIGLDTITEYIPNGIKTYNILELNIKQPKYYGIEEFLNDAKSKKVVDTAKYPSVGKIVELLVGQDTAIKARATHNIDLINKKLLKLGLTHSEIEKLYLSMQTYTVGATLEMQKIVLADMFKTLSKPIEKFLDKKPKITQLEKHTLLNWEYNEKLETKALLDVREKMLKNLGYNLEQTK